MIKRHKLDIFDFPISFLCEKYLEAMKTMEDLDIDVAAEFLAMAAELAHIKSKMLLPPDDDDDEDEEERDPRAELVRRPLNTKIQRRSRSTGRIGANGERCLQSAA